MIFTNDYCSNIELFKNKYRLNQSNQPCHSGLQGQFLVLDQTNPIVENFWSSRSSAVLVFLF